MTSPFDDYPADYRAAEVAAIASAVQAGESVSVVGLSGAGKSNLLGFVAARPPATGGRFALADCNRLAERSLPALFRLLRRALGEDPAAAPDDLESLDAAIERRLDRPLCLLLDRFDALAPHSASPRPEPADRGGLSKGAGLAPHSSTLSKSAGLAGDDDLDQIAASNLRALRDAHKYQLTFVAATRRPLPAATEFAELFHANVLWLGPLSESDARWNIDRYAKRRGVTWSEMAIEALLRLSGGYPSLLRAACEAYAGGAVGAEIARHPAMQARLAEFWADAPTDEELALSRLAANKLVIAGRAPSFDTTQLTAKEHLLLRTFQSRPGEVCEKDELIRAVWPEDQVFDKGVRDDSLAQLVRRLREKIEPEPSAPRYIHTVPGRGYRFTPG